MSVGYEDGGWGIEDRGTNAVCAILHLLASILILGSASGCVAAGMVASKVMGPPAVPAEYVPQQEPLAVLVESYHRPSSAYTDDVMLSRYIEDFLRENKVAPVIGSEKLRELRMSRSAEFAKMSVAAVGREVQAKQVLYVNMVQKVVEPLSGGEALRGHVAVLVKIVDAATGETRWPTDLAEGYPLEQSVQWGASNARSEIEMKQSMYSALADRIAKLFYKWKPQEQPPEGFTQ